MGGREKEGTRGSEWDLELGPGEVLFLAGQWWSSLRKRRQDRVPGGGNQSTVKT